MWLLDDAQRPILTEDGAPLAAGDAMPITDATVVKFANEQGRVLADHLARAYYLCDAARDQWDSLGGGQPAIDVMGVLIRRAADAVVGSYLKAFMAEKIWFLGVNVLVPNTSETIVDGSPEDGRPIATGAKLHAVMDRVVQFQNWLLSGTQSFTDAARDNLAAFNTVLEASGNGPPVLSVAAAGNMMNRAGELRTDYEATSGINLGTLLAFAVNPATGA